jgi:hypothetical protein
MVGSRPASKIQNPHPRSLPLRLSTQAQQELGVLVGMRQEAQGPAWLEFAPVHRKPRCKEREALPRELALALSDCDRVLLVKWR